MHFIVGIDLGTTNCAVAFVKQEDLALESPPIHVFDVPQLVRPGAVEPRSLFPSFLYLASSAELPAGATALPWDSQNVVIAGELARNMGARVPGRLVSSAKSWLCSPSVDRTAAILPWGAPEDVKRVSPVTASARYLDHIRRAWDSQIAAGKPECELAKQDVVLTVPASFDEAARELTVSAARAAGFQNITLLEEPQAAFYAWISENSETLAAGKSDKKKKAGRAALAGVKKILVCDVGGGTTDFSLIELSAATNQKAPVAKHRWASEIELRRSAVGDHLMLGGDNMDLAIARYLEKKLPGTIDAHQFKALTAAARDGKEKLLSEHAPEKIPITVMGRGTSVIGGSVRTDLSRNEIGTLLVEGFFPRSKLPDEPGKQARTGLREWGLPYVADPAVTRHLSHFLRHHLEIHPDSTRPMIPRPDAVLFNGGAMKPAVFRERILAVLKDWFSTGENAAAPDWEPVELDTPSLDLAVAQGAAYYGCVRRGVGLRIGGGMGRAYYIGIETQPEPGKPSGKACICLVPQGTEEGQKLELSQTFTLRLATPVAFPLYSSSERAGDTLGTIIAENTAQLVPLPPLETMLHAGRRAVKRDVAVRLQASLTEVGTLELALKSIHDDRKWEIHLNIRSAQRATGEDDTAQAQSDAGVGADPRKVDQSLTLIARACDPNSREPIPVAILTKQLEAALELSKEAWPVLLARKLADALLDQAAHRARSPELEARWLNLTGYLLRPGFGVLGDAERMKRLYNTTRNGLYFVSDPNCRIEWWVLWRRVSGGLKEDHERELFYRLQPFLTQDRDVSKRAGWPRPTKGEVPEMWRAAASLELLDLAQKKLLGAHLLELLEEEGPSAPLLWALGRLGAREMAHAQANYSVPAEVAETWLKTLLGLDWAGNPAAVFAAVSLSRKTGDAIRDVSPGMCGRVADRLKKVGASEHDINAVRFVTELESSDRKMIFGDSLPPALKLSKE